MLVPLLVAANAATLDCAGIRQMLDVNVPVSIVVSTLEHAPAVAPGTVECLAAAHVDPAILAAAGRAQLVAPPTASRARTIPVGGEPPAPIAALVRQHLDVSAELALLDVLARGPDEPGYGAALATEVALVERTGDTTVLLPVLAALPPDVTLLGSPAANRLRARAAFDRGDFAAVPVLLAGDSPTARYLGAVASVRRGHLKTAVQGFTALVDAARAARPRTRALALDADDALLGIARVYFSIGRAEEALGFYAQVARGSPRRPDAELEAATAALLRDGPRASLARLDHVDLPRRAFEAAWLAFVARLEIREELHGCFCCDAAQRRRAAREAREDARRSQPAEGLARLEASFVPALATLDAAAALAPDARWRAFEAGDGPFAHAPPAVRETLRADPDVAALERRLSRVRREATRVDDLATHLGAVERAAAAALTGRAAALSEHLRGELDAARSAWRDAGRGGWIMDPANCLY
jgi:tetratricopeptide (TPR) repeat protein